MSRSHIFVDFPWLENRTYSVVWREKEKAQTVFSLIRPSSLTRQLCYGLG